MHGTRCVRFNFSGFGLELTTLRCAPGERQVYATTRPLVSAYATGFSARNLKSRVSHRPASKAALDPDDLRHSHRPSTENTGRGRGKGAGIEVSSDSSRFGSSGHYAGRLGQYVEVASKVSLHHHRRRGRRYLRCRNTRPFVGDGKLDGWERGVVSGTSGLAFVLCVADFC